MHLQSDLQGCDTPSRWTRSTIGVAPTGLQVAELKAKLRSARSALDQMPAFFDSFDLNIIAISGLPKRPGLPRGFIWPKAPWTNETSPLAPFHRTLGRLRFERR